VIDGVEVCRVWMRTFQTATSSCSPRTEEIDKLIGLSVGADDLPDKTIFSPRELLRSDHAMFSAVLAPPTTLASSCRKRRRESSLG